MATATSIQYVQKMFIAYLGRGASTEALTYWGDQIDADAAAKDALFFDLYNSTEGTALYDGKTQDQIINAIFQNSFERDAKDAGKTFYKAELDAGNLNLVSMAGAIVDSADTAGAAVFAYKNEAADYYRTQIDAASDQTFDATESKNSVASVDGPNTLADSKATTDAIASGVGETFTLTTGTDTLAMTAGDDAVTGTVGTGATFNAADSIADTSTTDQDTLTLTGNSGFTAATVSNIEALNMSLARQNGAAFAIEDAAKITGSTINLTVADKVTVASIEVDGETEVAFNGDSGGNNKDALVNNLNTVNVTKVTAEVSETGTNSADITISGDADLKTVILTGVDDNDTVITTGNNDSSVSVVGTTAANDSVSVTGVGKVALDLETGGGGGSEVEIVTLAGSGGAVAFTVTNALESSATKITTAGDQAITLTGAAAQFNSAVITQGGTGTLGYSLTTAGDLDVTGQTLAGGVSLAADQGAAAKTFTVASGTTVSIDALQNADAALTIDANDAATTSTLVVNANQNAGELAAVDFETITINTNDSKAITIDEIDMNANDANVAVGGSNDVTITKDAVAGGDISFVGRELVFKGDVTATKGDITITAAGKVDADDNAKAITAQNDITITATNDVDLVTTTSSGVGNVTVTGNDIDAANIFDIDDGNLILTSTGSRIDVEEIDLEDGAVTITSATGFDASAAIAATNDVAITATNEVVLDSTVTTTLGGISISGNDITITAAVTASAGDVTVTATNDTAVSDINGTITAGGGVTLTSGKFDADTKKIEAQGGTGIVISGDAQLAGTAGATLEASSVTITSTSDQKIASLAEVTNTQGIVLSAGTTSGDITVSAVTTAATGVATLVTGGGADSITINNATTTAVISTGGAVDAVTLTNIAATGSSVDLGDGDDTLSVGAITTALVVNGGAGDDSVTLLGDTTSGTIDMGAGSDDSIVLDTGDYSVSSGPLAMKNVEEVDISAGDATFDWSQLSGNDSAFELKGSATTDELVIHGGDTGDTMDLTGITSNALALAAIKVVAGNGTNVITGAESMINTITGGTGVDTITGGDAADVFVGGNGNDTITAGAGADTITAGLGTDSIVLGAAGDVDKIIMTTGGAIDVDAVSGFIVAGGEDEIEIDLSDINALITGVLSVSDDSAALAATASGVGVVTAAGAGAHDFGATAAMLTTIAGTTAYTEATMKTHIQTNGLSGGNEAGDGFLIAYDDTANTYIAYVEVNAAAANGAALADVTVTNILTLTGVGAAETLLTTSLAIVA